MTQINIDQVSALLAALGLSSTNSGTVGCDGHGNNSGESVQGPLHSFYCYNCSFPNVIPVNVIPTLVAIPYQNAPSNASQSEHTGSFATATQTDGVPPAPASTPNSAMPAAVSQSTPSAPAAGSSVTAAAAATTTTGPDGPWYSVSKGRAVGVFRGWQNVTPLITGVSRACYLRHPTQAAAQAAFNEAIMGGTVEVLQ